MTEVIKDSNENPEKNNQSEHHRIKSFVVRAGRMTEVKFVPLKNWDQSIW